MLKSCCVKNPKFARFFSLKTLIHLPGISCVTQQWTNMSCHANFPTTRKYGTCRREMPIFGNITLSLWEQCMSSSWWWGWGRAVCKTNIGWQRWPSSDDAVLTLMASFTSTSNYSLFKHFLFHLHLHPPQTIPFLNIFFFIYIYIHPKLFPF